MYNLTDNQRSFLRWIIQEIRQENLAEEFLVLQSMEGWWIEGYRQYRDTVPEVKQGTLNALVGENLLREVGMRSGTLKYVITRKAYEAVDTNFNEPDISFVKHLTPLADITNLDKQLKKRCLPILSAGSSDPMLWDSAIRTAGVILEERLRDVGGISDSNLVGQGLVNKIFADSGSLVSKFLVDAERRGYRDLYVGIVGAFRNPSAHRFIDPTPEEGGALIVFINLLLRKLEELR